MSAPRSWYAAEVRVPPSCRDLALAVLADLPLTGMEEGPDESGAIAVFSEVTIDGEALERDLAALLPAAAEIHVRLFTVEEEDWLATWKAGWKPTPLGRRLIVVPAWWTEPLPADRLAVRLDPGLAFGTGTHETTALAWELLESALEEGRAPGPALPPAAGAAGDGSAVAAPSSAGVGATLHLLDVGAGTGVLSIGAVLVSPRVRVVATERDPLAAPTLAAALRDNGTADRVLAVRAATVPLRHGSVDLAAANLTAAEHRVVDEAMARVLGVRSELVLSGFLHPQIDEALERWRARGFAVVERRARGEWSAARLRRG